MSQVRQPVRAPYEISPEAAKRISWLRRRLLSWFPAIRPLLSLARGGQDAVRGRCGGNPAAEDDRGRGCADLRRVRRAFSLVGGSRAIAPGGASRTRSGHSDSGGRKAQAFQHLAQSIEVNGGVVPRTRKELERLPGIGPYTASAVLAIVYGGAEAAPRCQYGPPPGAVPRTHPKAPRQAPDADCTRSLFVW